MVGHGWKAREHLLEVGVGIEAAALSRDDERGGAVAGGEMADKEPVLRSQLARPNGVLDGVGVELGAVMLEMGGQRGPVTEQVSAGLAEQRARQALGLETLGGLLEQRQGKAEAALTPRRTQFGADLPPDRLVVIEPSDQAQHEAGADRSLGERLVELPTSVRPAAQPHDVGTRAHVGRVGFVAVGLERALIVAEQTFRLLVLAEQPPDEDRVAPGARECPQPTVGRLAILQVRIVAADRHLIDLHVTAGEQVLQHPLDQRFESRGGRGHPIAEVLPGDRCAPAGEHLFLPVKRQMVGILGRKRPGDQPGRGEATGHHAEAGANSGARLRSNWCRYLGRTISRLKSLGGIT